MDDRPQHGKDHRLQQAEPGDPGHEQARARTERSDDLARQGGATRHLARLIGLLRQYPLAGQPRGQDQQAKRRQILRHADGIGGERLPDQRQRGQKQQVDPAPGTGAFRTAITACRRFARPVFGRAIGAVVSAIALRHHTPLQRKRRNKQDQQEKRQFLQPCIGHKSPGTPFVSPNLGQPASPC